MKTITAIGNPVINERLKEFEEYDVIGKDIQYEEGIFEILEEINDIEIILLSNNLPEEFEFKILINKILKIKENLKIIVFLKEKDQELENYLNSKNIFDLYYLDNIDEFFYKINTNKLSNSKEIEKFKDELLKNIKDIDNFNKLKSEIINNLNVNINEENHAKSNFLNINKEGNKTIVITGNDGSGKSVFSVIFSDFLLKQKKKILLIDMNFSNSTISNLLEINYKEKKNIIVNIKHNLDVICDIKKHLFEPIFNNEYLYNEINKYKKNYDYIIIDLPGSITKEMVKETVNYADIIVYLFEPNLSEMQKANLFLEDYVNILKINNKKIKLVLNKTNKYKIARNIVECVFSEFEIIGDIEYNERLNFVINKSLINELNQKSFEKTFEKINI